jgi:tRNA pseudouridine13 synthase
MSQHVSSLAYANEPPGVSGTIRTQAEDFCVDEIPAFTPDGQGEHVLLHIEKKNTNTDWLAGQLARFVDVPRKDVSYAGLKDRNAVTTQWFSIRLAGKAEPDWALFSLENTKILEHVRHQRKIRRGALKGNHFKIIIRDLQGNLDTLEKRLQRVSEEGVPNYFAEQRFGRNDANLQQAEAMFSGKRIKDRNKRSMYLSAARSFLFNLILSHRVENKNWNQAITGDAMQLSGSNSFFCVEEIDDVICQRVDKLDIHPTAVLWGKGELATQDAAKQIEESIVQAHPDFEKGLIKMGLEQSRRALRLCVENMEWRQNKQDNTLQISFILPAGSYATSVLREILITQLL